MNNPVRGATWSARANPPPSPLPDDGGRDGAGLSCEIAACKAIGRSLPAVVGVDESAAECAAGDESKGERSSLEAESMGLHAVRTRQPGRARARFSGAASRQEGRVTCLGSRRRRRFRRSLRRRRRQRGAGGFGCGRFGGRRRLGCSCSGFGAPGCRFRAGCGRLGRGCFRCRSRLRARCRGGLHWHSCAIQADGVSESSPPWRKLCETLLRSRLNICLLSIPPRFPKHTAPCLHRHGHSTRAQAVLEPIQFADSRIRSGYRFQVERIALLL